MTRGNPEMMEALQALAADKGISAETLMGALADALESAYQKMPNAREFAWVTIDPESFDIRVWARELDDDGDPVGPELDVTPDNFGRIAAQTTRQVMTQRLREVDREMKYEEYAGREGDIVTGIIQQSDSRYTLLDLGRVEALLPQSEQVNYERPEPGERVKAYIVEVRKTVKGPQIVVSRTHPGLIRRLFELEVPEIADGIVEIKACAREPGQRTKIAVWSNDPNVDPVGACVGARGAREPTLVPHRDREAGHQERRLADPGHELVEREHGVRREHLTIGPVAHAGAGAGLGRLADDDELGTRHERRER